MNRQLTRHNEITGQAARRIILLEDAPSTEDVFSRDGQKGPHTRVAEAILEVINSPATYGGRTIALEGAWGSGKTTVINLLQQLISTGETLQQYKYAMLCLDAWAHEGNTLRRTILEQLIDEFIALDWVDKKHWSEKKLELSHRLQRKKITVSSGTTTLGKIFGISVILIPLGTALLGGLVASRSDESPALASLVLSRAFGIALLLSTAPLLVLLFNLLIVFARRLRDKWIDKKWYLYERLGEQTPENVKSRAWKFQAEQRDEEIHERSEETPEPTSIDFENTFNELLASALGKNADRALVLVLDNLDRVDSQDAIKTWATLQTFVGRRAKAQASWFSRVTLIIPYDPIGLKKLWDNQMSRGQFSLQQLPEDDTSNTSRPEISESFLEKSFQIRFELPPPVHSNWMTYLLTLLQDALPDHDTNDLFAVYRIFNSVMGGLSEARTPRELKLFVNQLGAIQRQWPDEFPITHIAYYVALRRRGREIRTILLKGEPLPGIEVLKSITQEPELRDNISGILYNVNVEVGRQLLLTGPLEQAFTNRDGVTLAELERSSPQGFWLVLDTILHQDTIVGALGKEQAVCNVSRTLIESEVFSKGRGNENEKKTILQRLHDLAKDVTTWDELNDLTLSDIASLITLLSREEATSHILDTVRTSLLNATDTSMQLRSGILKGLHQLISTVQSLGHQTALKDPFALPGDQSAWLEWCTALAESGLEFADESITSAAIGNAIVSELVSKVQQGAWSDRYVNALTITASHVGDCAWSSLAKSLGERIDLRQSPQYDEITPLFSALVALRQRGVEAADKTLTDLKVRGDFMHWLQVARDRGDASLQAWCIGMHLMADPSCAAPNGTQGRSAEGHSTLLRILTGGDSLVAGELVKVLSISRAAATVLRVLEARRPVDALMAECCRIAAGSQNPEYIFTPEVIVHGWLPLREDVFLGPNKKELKTLIEKVNRNDEVTNSIIGDGCSFEVSLSGLYLELCIDDHEGPIRGWCCTEVGKLGTEKWNEILGERYGGLELVDFLLSEGCEIRLGQPFLQAVENFTETLLESENIPTDLQTRALNNAINLVSESTRLTFFGDQLKLISDSAGRSSLDGVFALFGEMFSASAVLRHASKIVPSLFRTVLKEECIAGLRWVERATRERDWLEAVRKDDVNMSAFIEMIRERLNDGQQTNDEIRELVFRIATNLQISA